MIKKCSLIFTRRVALVALLFFICVMFFGCAAGKQSIKEQYNEAYLLYKDKSYFRAKPRFKKIIERDPLNKYAVLSELHLAEILYEEEYFDESQLHYEEFLRLNPKADEREYIEFRIGMCYFGMISTYDRDQTNTENALTKFRDYFVNYPTGKYVLEVKEHSDKALAILLESEYNIGKFYYKMKKYDAAVTRCENIINKFTLGGHHIEETYLILAKSLVKLSNKDKFKSVYEEYKNKFPNGRLREEFTELLKDKS